MELKSSTSIRYEHDPRRDPVRCGVRRHRLILTDAKVKQIFANDNQLHNWLDMARERIARVLWNNPATGVMRHADTGYPDALACARENGPDRPEILR